MVSNDDVLRALEETNDSISASSIKTDVPLVQQGLDSLDMATLLLALETKFKKAVPPEKAPRLRTINDIVAYFNG